MSKDSYYFSHDSNACMDPRILKLRMACGWEGYGIFWGIIESLRNEETYMMSQCDIESLTLALAIDLAKLQQVLSKCLEVGLLVENEGNIYSESLLRRMEIADEIREKRRISGSKGGKATASAKQVLSKRASKTPALKETKGKETNKTKEMREAAFAATSKDLGILNDTQLLAFVSYWTESNDGENTKLRFEKEKTFDTKRRAETWLKNSKDWGKPTPW